MMPHKQAKSGQDMATQAPTDCDEPNESASVAHERSEKKPQRKKSKVKDMRGANQRKTPSKRGVPFKPSDSLVSFTLR